MITMGIKFWKIEVVTPWANRIPEKAYATKDKQSIGNSWGGDTENYWSDRLKLLRNQPYCKVSQNKLKFESYFHTSRLKLPLLKKYWIK